MSDKELAVLCKQWQAVLRLQDWSIKPTITRSSDMDGHNIGECHSSLQQKEATVKILHPDQTDKPAELVLIHELLHCHLNALQIPNERHVEEEQVINALSKAFYGLAVTLRETLKPKAKKPTGRK